MRTAAALLVLLAACSRTDRVVGEFLADAGGVVDAPAPDRAEGGAGFCAPAGEGRCRGPLVATAFRYAVCVCGDQSVSGALATDSFDSALGGYRAPGGAAGSVGVNGSLESAGGVDVGGALLVGGAAGVAANGPLRVRSARRVNGPLQGSADATLADASFRGDVRARDLRVRGTLTLPAGRSVNVTGVREVARTEAGDVPVPPPCDCDPARRVDVAALVAARRDDNDNAAVGLAPDALAREGRPARVALPCGRYHLRGVAGAGALTLVAAGRVALFIEGSLLVDGDLRVELTPGAEVDVFVTGDVNLPRSFAFGDPAAPARARMFVGGSGAIALAGGGVFGGNLHAPGVELRLSGDAEVYGSLVARRVVASGLARVHFDRAVLDPGAGCGAPAGAACSSCRDCPAGACVDGRCGACRGDGDCCAPLRCAAGRCAPEPP